MVQRDSPAVPRPQALRFADPLERELERDRGRRAGRACRPADAGRPVEMAAQYPLDGGMALDQSARRSTSPKQREPSMKPMPTRRADGGSAVSSAVRRFCQPVGEPVQPPVAQSPGTSPAHQRVQRDDPHRQMIDGVLEERTVRRQPGLPGAEPPQGCAVVMVAGTGAPGERSAAPEAMPGPYSPGLGRLTRSPAMTTTSGRGRGVEPGDRVGDRPARLTLPMTSDLRPRHGDRRSEQ